LTAPSEPAPDARPRGVELTRGRLEAFSDGVIAILITIMILELGTPRSGEWSALKDVWGTFLLYALSFVFLGIYWSNHHHMLALVDRVSGSILWANLHLLFWLSMIPFATRWMGLYGLHTAPTAIYGVVGLMAAIAYYILARVIMRTQGKGSPLAIAFGKDWKGKVSPVAYAVAIAAAFLSPWISVAIYIAVALMWLVPDRRIESQARSPDGG
jgi:uncharacterized membrane protein